MIYVCPVKDCRVSEPCKPCICGMDTLKAFGGTKDPKPRIDPPHTQPANEKAMGAVTEAAMTAAVEAFERAPSLPLRFRIRCALACALPHIAAAPRALPAVNYKQDAVQTAVDIYSQWRSTEADHGGNDGQRHTHSWHSREDFIAQKLPELLRQFTSAPEGRAVTDGWYSTDCAPKDGAHVLITCSANVVGEAFYEPDSGHQDWFWAGSHWTDAHNGSVGHPVLGWRPLPCGLSTPALAMQPPQPTTGTE